MGGKNCKEAFNYKLAVFALLICQNKLVLGCSRQSQTQSFVLWFVYNCVFKEILAQSSNPCITTHSQHYRDFLCQSYSCQREITINRKEREAATLNLIINQQPGRLPEAKQSHSSVFFSPLHLLGTTAISIHYSNNDSFTKTKATAAC